MGKAEENSRLDSLTSAYGKLMEKSERPSPNIFRIWSNQNSFAIGKSCLTNTSFYSEMSSSVKERKQPLFFTLTLVRHSILPHRQQGGSWFMISSMKSSSAVAHGTY